MMKYTLIEVDGTTTHRDVMDLKDMKEFVKGDIERVGNMISNDDGIRLDLPNNLIYPRIRGNVIVENR